MKCLHHLLNGVSDLAKKAHYNVGEFASCLRCSRRQLVRSFQREFGCTPKAALDALRWWEARQMLESNHSAKEIAGELSFTGPSSLRKWLTRKRRQSGTRITAAGQFLHSINDVDSLEAWLG